jgi:hypothetical protein
MALSIPAHPPMIALLSAIGVSSTYDDGPPLLFGEPLISLQIDQLRSLGINRFWIEVDTLPGAIVAVADHLREQGVVIDFVRSPQELSGKLEDGTLLFVQSEGIFADEILLAQILQQRSPIIATIDNRADNEHFERIDLNMRWTGLALFDRRTIDGIAALPDGWSIASSLLRQAVQDKLPHKPVKQEVIQQGQLRMIASTLAANNASNVFLKKRAASIHGWIEGHIFAPIVIKLLPFIWPLKSRDAIIDSCTIVGGLSAFGLAVIGFGTAAAVLATLTMFASCIRHCLKYSDNKGKKYKFVEALMWLTLASTFLVILYKSGQEITGTLFPGIVVIALLLLAQNQKNSGLVRNIMPSPAMVASLMLVALLTDNSVGGAMLIALLQLIVMLLAKIKSSSPE